MQHRLSRGTAWERCGVESEWVESEWTSHLRITGWCFGTWFYFPIHLGIIIPTDFHNHQSKYIGVCSSTTSWALAPSARLREQREAEQRMEQKRREEEVRPPGTSRGVEDPLLQMEEWGNGHWMFMKLWSGDIWWYFTGSPKWGSPKVMKSCRMGKQQQGWTKTGYCIWVCLKTRHRMITKPVGCICFLMGTAVVVAILRAWG